MRAKGEISSSDICSEEARAFGRLGVLIEVNCETDFVAKGDRFKELVADMAMQARTLNLRDRLRVKAAPHPCTRGVVPVTWTC